MTVLVTGASSGIGLSVCRRLLEEGRRVIGLARDFSKTDLAHEKFTAVTIDLSDINKIAEVSKRLLKVHPEINAVVCNAGGAKFGNLEEFSFAQIQDMIQLNLTSAICLVRAFLPHLKSQPNSHVILMGSETALQGGIKGAVYSACKFGLRGFAQSLRKEGAKNGLHVSIINPGMVKTAFHDEANFKPGENDQEHLQAEDIAAAVSLVLNARTGCVIDEMNLSPLKHVIAYKNT